MTVSVMARRASGSVLRTLERSNSCPDLSNSVPRLNIPAAGSIRHLNLMVMHPRAPKIRHLNASHSLLIELEANVKKVQDLENTVIELEKQLQWRDILKKEAALQETKQAVETTKQKTVITEEEHIAFRQRLEEAKKKAEQISMKRDEEEAKILRSWHKQKLKSTIDQMSQIPETENEVKLLASPEQVNTETVLFSDFDTMVDMANTASEPATYRDELVRLETLLGERDSLGKLFDEVQVKEIQTVATIQECRNAITSINTMRIKLKASLNMSQTLLKTMQTMEHQRKNLNMFVYGPNPIFSSARDMELNFSINNQFVLDMLQELDISYHVAQNNMRVARECKKNYKQNKAQILESLQSLQMSIDAQSQLINSFQSSLATQKSLIDTSDKKLVTTMEAIINDKVTKIHENEI